MARKINKRDSQFLIAGVLLLTIVMQLLFVPRLPRKYFYDSQGILTIANGDYNSGLFDKSYIFAGNFYRTINIFDATTFEQWALIITAISSVVILAFLFKRKADNIYKLLFIYLTIALANIYLFRIGKDFIQLLFFAFCAILLSGKKQKIVPALIVLVLEGLLFRSYYIGIALLSFLVYLFIKKKEKKSYKKTDIVLIVGLSFVTVLIISLLLPSSFSYIANIRSNTNQYRLDSPDAITMIKDIIPGNSAISFTGNIIINISRILFPIELLFKGIKYIPFIMYQVLFIAIFVRSSVLAVKHKEEKNYIYISIIVAFLLVSSIFEPDFGSVIRHEIALLPIYLPLFLKKDNKQ